MKALDEKGFVFMGADKKPYLCRMWHGAPWFMYWHEHDKTWVTLKEVTQQDIWFAVRNELPQEQQDIYHELHQKFLNALP